jgi:hypothetical protein
MVLIEVVELIIDVYWAFDFLLDILEIFSVRDGALINCCKL